MPKLLNVPIRKQTIYRSISITKNNKAYATDNIFSVHC